MTFDITALLKKGIRTEALWANPIGYMLDCGDCFERTLKRPFLWTPVSLEAIVRWFSLKIAGWRDCFQQWKLFEAPLSRSDVWKLSCWVARLLIRVTTAAKEKLNRLQQLVVPRILCLTLRLWATSQIGLWIVFFSFLRCVQMLTFTDGKHPT